jgi:ketosteroid isomerase-like protein
MRTVDRPALVLACLVFLAACATTKPKSALSDADVTAIRTNIDAYVKALLASDWDAWGKTLLPDVVVMPPNHAPLVGRDAAVAYIKTFPKLTALTPHAEEVTGEGDLAYVRGTYVLSMIFPNGSSASDSGSVVSIHRRQSDGTWLFSQLIWHPDAAPGTAPGPATQ